MERPSSPDVPRFDWRDALFLTAAGTVLVLFRLHAFPAPLESDECNYAYFAQRLLEGDRLYVDLWDHQPPGIFAFLTLPTAIFGSAPVMYRTLALAACLITLALLFDIARRCFGRLGAWTAAMAFALVSSDPGTGGEGCNREIYMNLLLVAAVWVLAAGCRIGPGAPHDASDHESPALPLWSMRRLFIAGALIGLASTIKTVVAAQWLVLFLVVLFAQGQSAKPHGRLASAFAFAAGPAIIWLGIWTYFAATGRGGEFTDAAFMHNLAYSGAGPRPLRRLVLFFDNANVFRTAFALWLAGAMGVFALPWKRDLPHALLLTAFAIGGYLAVCLPGRFWPHYYHLMLPPLALLTAGLVYRVHAYRRGLGLATAATIVAALLATQVPGYLMVEPDLIAWDRYKDRMVWGRDQARRVASVTDPDDAIYVWGADASFYYYAQRRCATRYTMYLPLIADDPGAADRRRVLVEDLTRRKPRLILLPRPPCPELFQFIQEHRYVSAGFDPQVGPGPRRLEVLCDIERPIPRIDWTWKPD